MIAILQPKDFYGLRQRVGRDLLASAERVTCSLHDEGRRFHLGQMSGPQLLGLAGRVEGITKTQQALDAAGGMEIVGDHAGDPAAHRLAADDQRAFGFQRIDCGKIFRTEFFGAGRRLAGGRAAADCHVVEFEARNAEARVGQRPRGGRHYRRIHRAAGAMRQEDGPFRPDRAIDEEFYGHRP